MSETNSIVEKRMFAGNPTTFAIGYAFVGEDRTTELSMFINGDNILGFMNEGVHRTTRWPYLNGLVSWLRNFVLNMHEDPYPIEAEGEFAAQKDSFARAFSSDDPDEMDAYYEPLLDWAYNHTWLHERGGAILSNVYFEYRNNVVEISWDNRRSEKGVTFDFEYGGTRVEAELFKKVVLGFSEAYEQHWGIAVNESDA